jgi:membrane protease YdiL (CAAX protease family)
LVVLGLFAYGYAARLWSQAVHLGPSRSNFSSLPHASTVVVVLSGFAAIVSAPVMEEVFWRGMFYPSLRNRLGVLPACMAAAALFGAIHFQYPWAGRAEVAMFGVIATFLYEYTGSLLPGIALHSMIDGSGFERGLTGHTGIVLSSYLLLALALVSRDMVRRVAGRGVRSTPAD